MNLRKLIVYGSKITLIHLSTGKYLSIKGVKYDFGSNNQQYMVICSDLEIDSENDVWILVETNGKVTLRPGEIGVDDEWLIRRYNLTTSYDTDHLMNGDIIGLFHNITNKPALYSHAVLLGDGSQEVSCFGDGSENNNKVSNIPFQMQLFFD
ncbi:uncharacterized protein OCT59_011755 [Rhizophagus irregularis]|uniref:uncharacterized protein n=1 Tax=Rhizophagus irregularis TaxID=588596 RepID=UPI000CB9BE25|nr:hypothetical protein OCT59_011755 [Rhizophagus irregularis]